MNIRNTTKKSSTLSVFKKQIVSVVFLFSVIAGIIAPLQGIFSQDSLVAHAAEVTQHQPAEDPINHIEGCGVFDKSSNIMGCVTRIFYAVPYSLGFWALTLSARLLDASAAITLSSRLYTKAEFIYTGWRLTRDFANILFIIILLYIALSLILNLNTGENPKKILANLVIMGLLVNFSLFFTQVVIDLSNSLALVFYNQIYVVQESRRIQLKDLEVGKDQILGEETRPLSLVLAESFKPHQLASPQFYNCLTQNSQKPLSTSCTGVSDKSRPLNDKGNPTEGNAVPNSLMIPLLIVMGSLFLVAAYSFFIVSLAFIGRVVSLWIAIIFAPLAFVSYIVPSLRKNQAFGWNTWSKKLIDVALAAPIYFFFMLFIALMANTTFSKYDGTTAGEMLIISLIGTILLIVLLLQATKQAKKASGEIAERVVKFGVGASKFVGGAAIGLAAGTAAFAGRKTVGRVSQKLRDSDYLKKAASGKTTRGKPLGALGQWAAKQAIVTGEKGTQASFDIRQNPLSNLVAKQAGMSFESVGPLSTGISAGGWEAALARQQEKTQRWENRLAGNKELADKLENEKKGRDEKIEEKKDELARKKEQINATKNLEKKIEGMYKKNSSGLSDAEQEKHLNDTIAAEKELEGLKDQAYGGKSVNDIQQEINDLKNGKRGENGEKLTVKEGDTMKDENGKVVLDGNGDPRKYTAKEAGDHNLKNMENMSVKDLEKAQKNSEKDLYRNYLYNRGKDSGYHTEAKRDTAGNIQKVVVDTKEKGKNNWWRALAERPLSSAAIGTAIGTAIAPGVGTAIGFKLGAMTGGLYNVAREVMNKTLGGAFGSSIIEAKATANAAADRKLVSYQNKASYKGSETMQAIRDTFKWTYKKTTSNGGDKKDK